MKRKLTTEEFICRAKEKHGDRYDYSKVNYVDSHTKVCITCPEHGEFWQIPNSHLNGHGCPKCVVERQHNKFASTTEQFIEKAKSVHGDKFDYSKVIYYNGGTKVCIICPEHGEFYQLPNSHLNGHGCPKCAIEHITKSNTMSFNEFIEKAKLVHRNKYDYSMVEYINAKSKVCIICPEHGEFWQEANAHLSGCGCPKCVNQTSSCEKEIIDYLKNIYHINIVERDKKIIKPYEIDIYIPSLKFGIEYNGLYWHSEEQGKDKNYHLKKLELCKKQNVKLIQIFEDEYVNHKEIVYNKISHIIGLSKDLQKIPGRKCIIDVIDKIIAEEFLEKYHIQGFDPCTVYLGAFYNSELVAAMSFKQEIKGGTRWELTRFASDYHFICQGVGGKLFKYFVNNYKPSEIKSFADRRWTVNEENNVYLQLGFKFDKYILPDYTYFKSSDGLIRQHKFGFRKDKLNKKYGLPLTMTETEMMKQLGYKRIWNCGLIKYVWRKENATS